ncbi:MAG: di-trans,poly-cis-decaprenylcistransferase [Armatimonadetes bacterium]|nr:di-trans,poly-cis-decaprenylcistransferase [Armatimonadota bacterium]
MPSSELLQQIRLHGQVPRHVAIIMDGNGRWAKHRSLPRAAGHKEGMKAVRETIEGAIEAGIEILTLFAFSTENWQRPRHEITALMGLLRLYAAKEKADLREQGVEVHVLGDVAALDGVTRRAVEQIAAETAGGLNLRLNLMISYSGREEILRACRELVRRAAEGDLAPDQVDEELFRECLFTRGLPDPDLLIRTSGELRLSNFMLWQLAYTELYMTRVLWPDFSRADLFRAVSDFQERDRRFGRVAVG